MEKIKNNYLGYLICVVIAIIAYIIGIYLPIIGGPVIAILLGMIITFFIKDRTKIASSTKFISKKVLQFAIILLGFGLDLNVVIKTGAESLPIIASTICISLIVSFILGKVLHVSKNTSTLVGVGSSICGGSAIAATAPVIHAEDDDVAQAISVIFFFNVIAALLFPHLGTWLGFNHNSGNVFGIFAGTAINDTSSVTAAASTWDSMYNLGTQTLEKAVTVKLTRTLAIIPITLVLGIMQAKKENGAHSKISIKKVFPMFILYFIIASIITTICLHFGVSSIVFSPFKTVSKFLIILAMAAIGLNSNIIKLFKSSGKPLIIGLCCSVSITLVSLLMQFLLGIWK